MFHRSAASLRDIALFYANTTDRYFQPSVYPPPPPSPQNIAVSFIADITGYRCGKTTSHDQKWPFFRPKRRKQAFIGSRNKRPSSAVLLPDAVARWRGRRALPQSPFGRHEVNIAEKRLDKSVYLSRNGVVLCCIGAVPAIRSVSTVA